MYTKIKILFFLSLLSSHTLLATSGQASDSIDQKYTNWFNLDAVQNNAQGVSTEKAFHEILRNNPSRTVVVAIIDSGVDIKHEDLQGNIWVNDDEIPGNGIDDDQNGYVDDINGWNFLGNSQGENIDFECYEITRLYKNYKDKFDGKPIDGIAASDKKAHKKFLDIKSQYHQKLKEAREESTKIQNFDNNYRAVDGFMKKVLGKEDYTLDDLRALQNESEQVAAAKDILISLYENGFTREGFNQYKKHIDYQLKYHLNTSYNPRTIIGDDPENIEDTNYGNNDVIGADAGHGTHVAGIIAAVRNNGKGINGVADNVKIMAIRAVPDGDERDKDVANAIKYAVNNGAQIINMSFGKKFSPQKQAVDEAVKLAREKGVLLIHAAGNEADNLDEVVHYPTNLLEGNRAENWITVGASAIEANRNFVADFSNYGRENVDLFAPGVDIYSLKPGNEYGLNSGTSMACPVTTGVAALIMSYYPNLDIYQVKEILMESTSKYRKLKVHKPEENTKKKKKVKFKKLSVSGGVINAYRAVQLAEKLSAKQSAIAP